MSAKSAALSPAQKNALGNSAKGGRTSSPLKFRLRYVAVIVVLIWGAYQYLHIQKTQYQQLQQKETQLNQQLQAMKAKQDDLVRQAKELNNDTYIARYASQHFNLVTPGQVSFVVEH